jgi:hypothetical protein
MADRTCPQLGGPCPIDNLPRCGGEFEPVLCTEVPDQLLIDKSKYYSSQEGWPVVPTPPLTSWVANYRHIAPAGALGAPKPHEGHAGRKPWSFEATATIAHLNTPEPLALVVELLRLQTARPYILIVDTGSNADTVEKIETLRADDLEIHYLRSHAWRHSSEPVAAACDLAMDLCRTDLLFLTHADCFLRRRDLIADLVGRCDSSCPLVGYRLTERRDIDDWRLMVGHTCTMVHIPTARRLGARWGPWDGKSPFDTEYQFNRAFLRAGIKPAFLGDEKNYERTLTDDLDHVRSYGSAAIYRGLGPPEYQAQVHGWMREAMDDARARIARWKKPPLAGGAQTDRATQEK